jgi:hypothetical protein
MTDPHADVPIGLIHLVSRSLRLTIENAVQQMQKVGVDPLVREAACAIGFAATMYNMLDYCLTDAEARARVIATAQELSMTHLLEAEAAAAACGLSLDAVLFPTTDVARITCPACIAACAAGGKQ